MRQDDRVAVDTLTPALYLEVCANLYGAGKALTTQVQDMVRSAYSAWNPHEADGFIQKDDSPHSKGLSSLVHGSKQNGPRTEEEEKDDVQSEDGSEADNPTSNASSPNNDLPSMNERSETFPASADHNSTSGNKESKAFVARRMFHPDQSPLVTTDVYEPEVYTSKIGSLTHGQRRILAIAASLLTDPSVVLLDEVRKSILENALLWGTTISSHWFYSLFEYSPFMICLQK